VFAQNPPSFLLASADAGVLSQLQPILASWGGQVEAAHSVEAAVEFVSRAQRPVLAVLDVLLPRADAANDIDLLLSAAHSEQRATPLSVVVIADHAAQVWSDRLADGRIDDLILRGNDGLYWKLRIDMVLRHRQRAHELERYRESAALNAQMDHLTGVYNRETILTLLFKETDRIQRSNGALSLLLLDLDDFGHWNFRLGNDCCDDLLCQVASRITRLQRSYDLLGRPGKDEFLLVLPGCSVGNAALLAERIRTQVFSVPFHVGGEAIRLSACFGIAGSKGRSPVVVLRDAEQALRWARTAGPESIQCFGDRLDNSGGPVNFLTASSEDGLLAW